MKLLFNPLFAVITAIMAFDLLGKIYVLVRWPESMRYFNPIVKAFVTNLGAVPGLVVLTVAWIVLLTMFYPRFAPWALWCALAVHVLIGWWNYVALTEMRAAYRT